MDTSKLMLALENDSNESLLNFTTEKIFQLNKQIILEFHLNRENTLELLNKLRNYKYVDEMSDLKTGTYLRWINIENPNKIILNKGALFCDTKIMDDGVYLTLKNFGYSNKHFQLSLDKNVFFQKLTDQELILLSALDHLSK
jgi:hypothetical protein